MGGVKSREQSWEPQDFVALSGVCGSADWGAWLGTVLGRAPGSMGKASWGDRCEGAVGGASLGVSQGSGERDGNGVPAGRGVAHRLASQEPASLPLGRGARPAAV